MSKNVKSKILFALVLAVGMPVKIIVSVTAGGWISMIAVLYVYGAVDYYLNNTPSIVLSVDFSEGEVINSFDTHGGFHGDGVTYLEMKMPYSFEDQLEYNEKWHSLPMPENIREICDLKIDKHNGKNSESTVPDVRSGYFYYLDRDTHNSFDFPMNFTVAVYDCDTYMIYYCKIDT